VSFQSTDPEVLGLTSTAVKLSAELERALAPSRDEAGRFWIAYDATSKEAREFRKWHDRVLSLLRYLVSGGIIELCLPEGVLSKTDWTQLTMRSSQKFLIRCSVSEDGSSGQVCVPRFTLVDEKTSSADQLERIMMLYRPQHIILAPKDTTDFRSPHRRLFDMFGHLSMNEILARLQS
jgi:hypothetical protein